MIEKRNGRWRARLRLNGQPEVSRTFATESAARQWHRQIEDAAKLGTLSDVLAAETTFATALRKYAESPKFLAQRGQREALVRIGQLEASPLADLNLSSITRRVLREHRDRRMDGDGIKGSTWNRELSLISQVLRFAVVEFDAKLDWRDVTDGLRGKESEGRKGRITPADEAALIEASAKVAPWGAAMIKLSLALGTRRTELWTLTHADVDRGAMRIHVRGTKTKGSDRVLPISSATLAVIDALPRSLTDDRILWQAEDADALTYTFRRSAVYAKREHLTLHLCRHEALSRLAEKGASIPLLRGFSGHSTMSMLSRYARPEAEGLRALVAAA